MFFRANRLYRHIYCVDIDFFVARVLGETEEYISVLVKYWNRSGYFQGKMQAVQIKKKDLRNWCDLGKL